MVVNIDKEMKKKKTYSVPTIEIIMTDTTQDIMYAASGKGGCSCGCESADKPHMGCWNCPDCNHENQGNHECYPETGVKQFKYSSWEDEL